MPALGQVGNASGSGPCPSTSLVHPSLLLVTMVILPWGRGERPCPLPLQAQFFLPFVPLIPQLQALQSQVEFLEQSMVDKSLVSRQEAKIRELETRLEFERTQVKRLEVGDLFSRSSRPQQGRTAPLAGATHAQRGWAGTRPPGSSEASAKLPGQRTGQVPCPPRPPGLLSGPRRACLLYILFPCSLSAKGPEQLSFSSSYFPPPRAPPAGPLPPRQGHKYAADGAPPRARPPSSHLTARSFSPFHFLFAFSLSSSHLGLFPFLLHLPLFLPHASFSLCVYFLPTLLPFLTLTYFFFLNPPQPIPPPRPRPFVLLPPALLLFLFTSSFSFHPSFLPTVTPTFNPLGSTLLEPAGSSPAPSSRAGGRKETSKMIPPLCTPLVSSSPPSQACRRPSAPWQASLPSVIMGQVPRGMTAPFPSAPHSVEQDGDGNR